jgi:MFS family permease
MQRFFRRLPAVTPGSTQQVVPPDLQRTFHHLYGDIAWYGLLAGTTIAFLGVYAARLGASALQIGLLTAGPALVNLIFTLPIGRWLQSRPIGRSVFGSAVAFRVLYLVYALLPLTLPAELQLEALIWATFLFTIPGVALAIGFNALFAAVVPIEYRGMVAGRRNALLSVFYIVASLLSGYILNNTSLEVGYTLIFGLGFVGAAMSTYHLSKLRGIRERPDEEPERIRQIIGDAASPGDMRGGQQGVGQRVGVGLRSFTRGKNLLRLEVLRGAYGSVILALFVFHTAQFMPGPLFPLRWVDALHLDDGQIAVGTAFFHGTTLLGSLGFANLSHRFGFHKLLVAGTAGLSLYPLFTAFMPNFFFYALTSIVGGLAWALVGGALSNYLLEKVPANDRPAYLAWYNLALNAAILLGALLGPLLASWFNLTVALVISFVFRLIGSVLIWWAEPRTKPAST